MFGPKQIAPAKKGIWKVVPKDKRSSIQDLYSDRQFKSQSTFNIGTPIKQVTLIATQYKGRCMWDHHDFIGPVHSCPIAYNDKTKVMTMTGGFCSPNCALSWGEQMSGCDRIRKNCAFWLLMLTRKTYKRAPSFLMLVPYGGHLTIEQYRANFKETQVLHQAHLGRIEVLPLAWHLWSVDKSQEVGKFDLPGKSNSSQTPVSRTEERIQTALKKFSLKRKSM